MNKELEVVHKFKRLYCSTITLSKKGEICSHDGNEIEIFRSDNSHLKSWCSPLVVNMLIHDSELYCITLKKSYEMQIFSLDGHLRRRWDLSFLNGSHRQYIYLTASEDEIYITHAHILESIIHVFNQNGLMERKIVISSQIFGMAFDNGELFIRQKPSKIVVLHPEGYFLRNLNIYEEETARGVFDVSHGYIFLLSRDILTVFSSGGDFLWRSNPSCQIKKISVQGEYILAAYHDYFLNDDNIIYPTQLQLWRVKDTPPS